MRARSFWLQVIGDGLESFAAAPRLQGSSRGCGANASHLADRAECSAASRAMASAAKVSSWSLVLRGSNLALRDALTGLANRRAFDDALHRGLAGARRTERPMTLLILDIDFFKQVNDTYGHATGDDVLRGVGRVIVASTRDADLPARIGGEEFVVVCPATDLEGARVVAERLRSNMEARDFGLSPPRTITVSIGLAESSVVDEDAEEFLARADRHLYAAKQRGRNQCAW